MPSAEAPSATGFFQCFPFWKVEDPKEGLGFDVLIVDMIGYGWIGLMVKCLFWIDVDLSPRDQLAWPWVVDINSTP